MNIEGLILHLLTDAQGASWWFYPNSVHICAGTFGLINLGHLESLDRVGRPFGIQRRHFAIMARSLMK